MTNFQTFGGFVWGLAAAVIYFVVILIVGMMLVVLKNLFPSSNFVIAFLIAGGAVSILLGIFSGRKRIEEIRKREHILGKRQRA